MCNTNCDNAIPNLKVVTECFFFRKSTSFVVQYTEQLSIFIWY